MQERPAGVPSDAYWDEDDNEWVLPERDSAGEFHGLVKWWRPDGTLCCVTDYEHGSPHGKYQRFHENGEVSREGTFVEGKLNGTDRYRRSSAETTETFPRGLGDAIFSAEMDYENGRVVAARCYNEAGVQCMEDGSPFPESRPDNVPEGSHFRKREADGEYRWVLGTVIDNNDGTIDRTGQWRWWSPEGVLVSEESYEVGKLHGTSRTFDAETGVLLSEKVSVNGKRHREREFEDGVLTSEKNFIDGEKRGSQTSKLDSDEE